MTLPNHLRDLPAEIREKLEEQIQANAENKINTEGYASKVIERVARFIAIAQSRPGDHSHLALQAKKAIDSLVEQSRKDTE